MRIDKEKFNKLKQLDRIEFRQKLNSIEDIGISFMNLVFLFVIILSIVVVGGALSLEINGVMHISFINGILSVANIIFFLVLLEVICILGSSFYRSKVRRELIEEYFVVEVKK